MAKLVIGTLDSIEATDAVIEDLEKAGFKRKEIFVTGPPSGTGYGGGAGAGAASELAPLLERQSVPRRDADEFAEAVRRGKALISVRTEKEDTAEKAADIMARHHVRGPEAMREGIREEEQMRGRDTESRRTEAGEIVVEQSRVRVYTRVTERPVEEDISLPEERVVVEGAAEEEKEKLEKK